MRVLPEDLRDILKEPIGKLVNEKQLLEILSDEEYIVSIGDQVTYTLLKNNIEPIFCVVDYKTRRGEFPLEFIQIIKTYGDEVVKVNNPQGCITDELWEAIENAFEDSDDGITTRIEVDGEEDLASLVAIFLAPLDVTIIYGLPNKGVLVVKPTSQNKEKVCDILNQM
jgi:uncharacterized protein (UPF0218 family)